jgi:hypothetical protein
MENAPNTFKKETAKAMVSIRQRGEFTNDELTQTQNIVDAMALFSVKEATVAKRRHYNKLVNVKLGIVQVKLRFHGGTRGKERVKELVSQVTERVLLVLCF